MLADKLLAILAPHACLARLPDGRVCGKEGVLACRSCLRKSVKTRRSTCFMCNRLTEDHKACESCRRKSYVSRAAVATYYDGVVKDLVGQLKFHHTVAAGRLCAKLVLPKVSGSRYDVVTSVPSATSRQRYRGYNPAELIAKELAARLDLPYARLLGRLGQKRQVGQSRTNRLAQMSGAFYPRRKYLVQGQKVLLVDDVLTTGATINECAKELKEAGAKRVEAAVVAKH